MAMGPQSKTSSGSGGSTTSIADPDQGGDAMAPSMGGEDEDMDQGQDPDQSQDQYMLPLPQGFKAPGGDGDGSVFTTTIQCTIVDGPNGKMLDISKIGDMPVDGSSEGTQAEESQPEQEESQTDTEDGSEGEDQPSPMLQKESAMYKKKRKDEASAKMAFQGGK